MASKDNAFAAIGRRMQRQAPAARAGEMPAIADLIRRIDTALLERRAA